MTTIDAESLIKNLNKITALNPEYYLAYRLLGEVYLACKDHDKAVQHLKKSL